VPRCPSPYGRPYKRERARLLAQGLHCALGLVCGGRAVADSADHDPPLALHDHRPGSGCCRLQPACLRCQKEQGKLVAQAKRTGQRQARAVPAPSRVW
jgi:hypothetical protein